MKPSQLIRDMGWFNPRVIAGATLAVGHWRITTPPLRLLRFVDETGHICLADHGDGIMTVVEIVEKDEKGN